MNVHGVDFSAWPGGLLSAAHTAADIELTADAFRKSVDWLLRTGVI